MPGGGTSLSSSHMVEGRDIPAMVGLTTVMGTMSATEGHDAAAIAGSLLRGTIAAAEGHDTASAAGGVTAKAAMARSEAHDAGMLAAMAPGAILTRLEAGDTAAASGVFGSVATAATTESRDHPAMLGGFTSAVLVGIEGRDQPSISGQYTASGSLDHTEARDAFDLLVTTRNFVAVTGVEAGDSMSAAGHFATPTILVATDGRDRATIVGVASYRATASVPDGRDVPAISGQTIAPPPSMQPREGRDIAAMVGSATGTAYNVYADLGAGDPINYSAAVATVAATTWSSGPLPNPGTWRYGVRAFNSNGEEQNIDCVVTIIIDASGRDITNRPGPPMGLRAFPMQGGVIRVEWFYPPSSGATVPLGFNVYCTAGTTVSYLSPAAVVPYPAPYGNASQANLSGLSPGTQYAIGVRAYNQTAEEPNQAFVLATSPASAPSAVQSLTCTASV